MASKINSKQQPRRADASAVRKPAANPHAPSVPISLYRQVAAELQAAQTQLESLQAQNQQLSQHNQKLRLEIERVVQSALQLRQVADVATPAPTSATPTSPLAGLELHFQTPPTTPAAPPIAPTPVSEPLEPKATSKAIFTEQESKPRSQLQPERNSEVNGWWLALIIGFIIVTAFGTGFLIVRPLLPSR